MHLHTFMEMYEAHRVILRQPQLSQSEKKHPYKSAPYFGFILKSQHKSKKFHQIDTWLIITTK